MSPWVGLLLIKPALEPTLPSPPINSLVPLRCPAALGELDRSKFAKHGEMGGERVDVGVEGLKEKLGNSAGIDIGRRPEALESDAGADDGDALAGKTKVGSCEGLLTSFCAVVDMVAMLPKNWVDNQQSDKSLEEYHMF